MRKKNHTYLFGNEFILVIFVLYAHFAQYNLSDVFIQNIIILLKTFGFHLSTLTLSSSVSLEPEHTFIHKFSHHLRVATTARNFHIYNAAHNSYIFTDPPKHTHRTKRNSPYQSQIHNTRSVQFSRTHLPSISRIYPWAHTFRCSQQPTIVWRHTNQHTNEEKTELCSVVQCWIYQLVSQCVRVHVYGWWKISDSWCESTRRPSRVCYFSWWCSHRSATVNEWVLFVHRSEKILF